MTRNGRLRELSGQGSRVTDGSGPLAETVRKRAIALYTFLKEFTELRMEIIRSLDSYEQVLWLHSVP